jgi:hypothetical protein
MERALAQVHWAVRSDNVEALKRLLDGEEGLELIDGADYDKRTPLHVAASNNSVAAAQLLLSAGAARDPLDRWNSTPLANAQERGFKSMVKLLKQYGARAAPGHSRKPSDSMLSPPKSSDWLITDPTEIDLQRSTLIGKGSFGEIRQTTWRGTTVAVKTIRRSLSKVGCVLETLRKRPCSAFFFLFQF